MTNGLVSRSHPSVPLSLWSQLSGGSVLCGSYVLLVTFLVGNLGLTHLPRADPSNSTLTCPGFSSLKSGLGVGWCERVYLDSALLLYLTSSKGVLCFFIILKDLS